MMEYITEFYSAALPMLQTITLSNIAATYAALAFSTGLVSYLTVYKPILTSLAEYAKEEEIDIFELRYPGQTAFILISLNTLLAPLIFKTCLTGPDRAFVSAYIDKVLPDEFDDEE